MNTKLTLRLERSLIAQAKKYAEKEGKSISQIVSDYFRAIPSAPGNQKVGPLTTRLRGCMKDVPVEEDDYRKHIVRKYL